MNNNDKLRQKFILLNFGIYIHDSVCVSLRVDMQKMINYFDDYLEDHSHRFHFGDPVKDVISFIDSTHGKYLKYDVKRNIKR